MPDFWLDFFDFLMRFWKAAIVSVLQICLSLILDPIDFSKVEQLTSENVCNDKLAALTSITFGHGDCENDANEKSNTVGI